MNGRPLGITLICIFTWIINSYSILSSISIIAVFNELIALPITIEMDVIYYYLSFILLIEAPIFIITAYWLWKMKKIGWTTNMILRPIAIILSLSFITLGYGSNIFIDVGSVSLALVFIIYLWMKRDLFK